MGGAEPRLRETHAVCPGARMHYNHRKLAGQPPKTKMNSGALTEQIES